jgi:hypothetical protein
MNLYRVSVPGRMSYTMSARSIAHAAAYVRHWANVRVMTIRPLCPVGAP